MAGTMGMFEFFPGRQEEFAKEKRRGPARELGTFYMWSWQQGELVTGRERGVKRGKGTELGIAASRQPADQIFTKAG